MSVIGPAVTNENASALMTLEFSKELLKPSIKVDALTLPALKVMFEQARARSNEIFQQMKPNQQLTIKELEDRANVDSKSSSQSTLAGDLPDGIDALIGRISLEMTNHLASCVILVQTSYEAPWEFALCVVGNEDLSFYAVFDAKRGTFERCKSLDAGLRGYLEKAGIYYRAVFVKLEDPVGSSIVAPKAEEPVAAAAAQKSTAVVSDKKEPQEESVAEEKKKKPAATTTAKKRSTPSSTSKPAAPESDQKKQAVSAPPPPPATAEEKK